ncbi:hypothetical protein ACFO4L_17375 [Bacillus daqingensis]|uniref:AtpZ/AtpI family protein n=1 Tax=Bacillus daqingensis TaxID=872396 RepID=A0ABV9NYI6_9BACI
MAFLDSLSNDKKLEYGIVAALLLISVAVGIFVGMNEEWFLRRNFTAGYMAGSLMSAVLLFGIYRTIAFFVNLARGQKTKPEDE